MLSRNVRQETDTRHVSPFIHLKPYFKSANFLFGNFEGAIADPSGNDPGHSSPLTFSISSSYVQMMKEAGYTTVSAENNHNLDLGTAGRQRTLSELSEKGIHAIDFDHSPQFFRFEGTVISIIAVNLIPGKDKSCQIIPSIALTQKIRLAKNLSNLVIVSIHWGSELLDWPNHEQRAAAQWLIRQGTDMIMGHHPHVIQNPEIIEGKPVFFSLGNLIFDQKYPSTKEGLIVNCIIKDGILSFTCIKTHVPKNSFFPVVIDSSVTDSGLLSLRETTSLSGIAVQAAQTDLFKNGKIVLEGYMSGKRIWRTKPIPIVSVEVAKLDGKNDYVFSLENHYSNMDHETGLRPYVYSVTRNGLIARWRGSALAWPLLDAFVVPGEEGIINAIHRKDSFIDPDPYNNETRWAVYKWNGFGFSGVKE